MILGAEGRKGRLVSERWERQMIVSARRSRSVYGCRKRGKKTRVVSRRWQVSMKLSVGELTDEHSNKDLQLLPGNWFS